jgi:signal peptidase I
MAAITSGSMWPALKQGDLVFIKGINGKDDLTNGDIIVYRNESNNTFTIHRVVKLGDEYVTTKGDANFNEDAPVEYKYVVGKTVILLGKPLRLPYLGSITVFASNLKRKNDN